MSDMSFKQAKELVEKIELAELTLKKTANDISKSTNNFNETLKKQEQMLKLLPITDKKLNFLKLLIVLHVGFIVGVVVGALLFKQ